MSFDPEQYAVAFGHMLARNRALGYILRDLMAERCMATDTPHETANITCDRVLESLDRKDHDARTKQLEIPFAQVKDEIDRFFLDVRAVIQRQRS